MKLILPILFLILLFSVGVGSATVSIVPPVTIIDGNITTTLNYSATYEEFTYSDNTYVIDGVTITYSSMGTSNITMNEAFDITVSGSDVTWTISGMQPRTYNIYEGETLIDSQFGTINIVVPAGSTYTVFGIVYPTTNTEDVYNTMQDINGYMMLAFAFFAVAIMVSGASIVISAINGNGVPTASIIILVGAIVALMFGMLIYGTIYSNIMDIAEGLI